MYCQDLKTSLDKMKHELVVEIKKVLVEQLNAPQAREWLSETEAREYLGVCKSTLQTYRREGIIPFSQIKSKIYFKRTDLEAHLDRYYTRKRRSS